MESSKPANPVSPTRRWAKVTGPLTYECFLPECKSKIRHSHAYYRDGGLFCSTECADRLKEPRLVQLLDLFPSDIREMVEP